MRASAGQGTHQPGAGYLTICLSAR